MAAKKTAVDKKQLEEKPIKKKRYTKSKPEDWLKGERLERLKQKIYEGLTDTQLAEYIGIGRTTFYQWVNENKQFEHLIKHAQDDLIKDLRNSLVMQAVGYKIHKQQVLQRTGQVVDYEEEVPRNVIATDKALRFFDKLYKMTQDAKVEETNKTDPLLDGYINNIETQIENTEDEEQ